MHNLSKSKIIAWRQCPKRLWLEIHKPDLRDDSASEAVFAIGNQVGEIARQVFDPRSTGVTIDIGELGHGEALRLSAELLAQGEGPIFEAGLTVPGALAYADVMLPDRSDGSLRWKMIEVKSSTGVKDYHRADIAVQSFISHEMGVPLSSIAVAHINRDFVYAGGGRYDGLFQVVDLSEETADRHDEVSEWIANAQAVAALEEEPEVATGSQCLVPFTCGFGDYCNRDKVSPEYPLSSLPRLHYRRREQIEAAGHEDLRDVPDELLGALQNRVKQCSLTGETYFDAEGAAAAIAGFGFPVSFLDFETVNLAVPIWPGTRPYQQIPFQFSLHTREEDGTLRHHGFLDLTGDDPSENCAKALIEHCGTTGPVFAYSACFEKRVIHQLAERFLQYAPQLEAIHSRIEDLLPVVRAHYYHPSQHGSWSLKAVLPAICPDLSYQDLHGVQDGGMAVAAYQEAIHLETSPDRKAEIREQLTEYCKLDTLALVRVWEMIQACVSKNGRKYFRRRI